MLNLVTVGIKLVTEDNINLLLKLGVVSSAGGGESGGGSVTASGGTAASAGAPLSNKEALSK